ncbi:MAG: DUF285 domain-containing protein, partial [Bacteroidales bacterium]|nr:DUF285 domain-containing protein [Bacteroidales bacterium]
YYSIANTYLQVNYKYGDNHNYGETTFRRTLNTEDYSILSCMPEDLQNGIVAKRVKYAEKAGSTTSEVCYDKLWMFSLYELGEGGSSVEGSQYYRPTSTNANNSPDNRTYKLYNRYETGEYGDWMLPRSLYGSYDKSIYNAHYQGDDKYGTITGGGSGGISFGFCLAGPEQAQELSAFAVYSADDSSLTFYTDYTVPTKGSTYNEKAVTAVYTDVDQTAAASADEIPWEDVCTDVTDVVIDPTFADAQPTSFAYWFDGFTNAAFSGLNYMDTTDVTSMSYMFHDCSSLTGLDLADWNTTSVAKADGEEFATGCPDLAWVKIGEDTNIFTLNKNVDQQYWYDSQANGNLVSFDWLQDVTEAGTYWSGTMETAGYITIKIGDTSSLLFYEDIDEAIAKAGENTFSCDGTPVTAQFVLLSELIGIDDDFCSYTVTAEDGSVTGGLPPDTYLYKTEDGKYRTAVDGGPESQWISVPETIEVVEDHVWDVEWTWTGLPLYCTTDNPDFEPLSVSAIQPWSVVQSLNIKTLSGDRIDATATAVGICENCGKTETLDAALTAAYLSDEPTEYVGALAEITATATFSDGQKVTDKVKVLAPSTGMIALSYLRDDETVKTGIVPYERINELSNKTEPFTIHYNSSGGNATDLTMPFVPISDVLGIGEDENFCCFIASGTDGFSATIPADSYFYQRNQPDNSGNAYYYRTAVAANSVRPTVHSSETFVSYVNRVSVQYMHQWGTPEWTWSDDHSSATVTVSCTRDNGNGMVVCDYTDEVTTEDITYTVTTEPTESAPGAGTYTATATLVDGTVVTDVQRVEIPALTPEAFAVYCAGNNSLTFAYGTAPSEGDTYNGQTVTTVYDDVDEAGATSAGDIPWNGICTDVTDVVIDSTFANAQPTSFAYWFDGFTNAAFTGLENMNTENVTDMSSMFHDCAALTELDLSEWNTEKAAECEQFATGCTDLEWVKIGDDFDLFAKSSDALVSQQTWYDSPIKGAVVSDNYMIGVSGAGT